MMTVNRPNPVMTAVVKKNPPRSASTNQKAKNLRNPNDTPPRQTLVPIEANVTILILNLSLFCILVHYNSRDFFKKMIKIKQNYFSLYQFCKYILGFSCCVAVCAFKLRCVCVFLS